VSVGYNYGRLPDDLRPVFARLSHLEMHVYSMLTITAVRSENKKDVGCVNISKSALAREMGIDRTSLRRAIKGLFDAKLLLQGGSSCPSSWGIMPHYLGSHDSVGGSSRPIKSPQHQQKTDTYEPLKRSEDVSEDEETVVAAELPVKKKQKRSPSWLIWSVEKDKLVTRNGDSNGNREFMARWKERLGDEDIIWTEKEAAEKWLRENPEKRIRTKRFDRFFGNWLNKRWEAS